MSLSPFVFVGVGGTGGKVLAVIYDTLQQALQRIGMSEMPASWQFVHIDVAANPDRPGEGMPGNLPRTAYLPLTKPDTMYTNYDQTLSSRLRGYPAQDYFAAWDSWRPAPPAGVPVVLPDGAGQYRAVGRVAAMVQFEDIARGLQRALDALKAPGAASQLTDFERKRGNPSPPTQQQPVVVLVGSASGGSGSGMLLDVSEVLRSLGAGNHIAVVCAPEVFVREDGRMEGGIAPNTFMAFNELSNAMWTHQSGDEPVSRRVLFAQAGQVPAPGRGGPASCLLIGRTSTTLQLPDAQTVYKVLGRSLAEMAMNAEISNGMTHFLIANGPATDGAARDHLGLSPTPHGPRDEAQFRSIGFGRLTVGREFFERYAVERLLRVASLRLLDRHLEAKVPGDGLSDEALLKKAADQAWPAFLLASKLSEVGANNQVTEALEPFAAITPNVNAWRDDARRAMLNLATGRRREIRTSEARATVQRMVGATREPTGLLSQADRASHELIRRWVDDIHGSFRTVVVDAIARLGLPVTVELLERLRNDIQIAIGELRTKEAPETAARADQGFAALATQRPDEPDTFSSTNTDQLSVIINDALDSIEFWIEAASKRRAADVLEDLIENLLGPWHREARDAKEQLQRRLRPKDGTKSLLNLWPGEVGVPEHLLPSTVEFPLDHVDEFPHDFLTLIMRSTRTDADEGGEDEGSALALAVTQILAGRKIPEIDLRAVPVARYATTWRPTMRAVLRGDEMPSRAKVELRFSVADLRHRATAWMRDDEKAFARYLTQTIGAFLLDTDVDAGVRDDRANRLRNQFRAALAAAAPLVKVDSQMLQQVHDTGTPPTEFIVEALDVPEQMVELRNDLEEIWSASGQRGQLRFATAPKSDFLVFSALALSLHPVELASIMEPITTQWLQDSSISGFWLYRRARPLPEWVPLSPGARRNLLLGWFVARLIGAASVGTANGRTTAEFTVNGTTHNLLAHGLSRPSVKVRAVPAGVVESVAFALMTAFARKNLEVLEPYRQLIQLGSGVLDGGGVIAQWITTGDGIVDGKHALLPAHLKNAEERVVHLQEALTRRLGNYAAHMTERRLQVVRDQEYLDIGPAEELHGDIAWALRTLLEVRPQHIEDKDDFG